MGLLHVTLTQSQGEKIRGSRSDVGMRTGKKEETPACSSPASVVGARLGAAKRIPHSPMRKTLYHKGAQRTGLWGYRNWIVALSFLHPVTSTRSSPSYPPSRKISATKAGHLSPIRLSRRLWRRSKVGDQMWRSRPLAARSE